MTKEERLKMYDEATKKWGWPAQIDQMIEEMAELILALNKYKRKILHNEDFDQEKIYKNLYTELADVDICLEQMIAYFGQKNVEEAKAKQLEKFKEQIANKR